ncbi:MAG TPA: redoxin domain-containing protein [Chloroflexota bacterium]|nr:redoxin domain-containing protein [Chloroflexota bacterium]
MRFASVARILALLLFLMVAVGALWWFLADRPASSDLPAVGTLAPDFTLDDVAGRAVTLSAYRGKTVILNFWATWCPPCRAEMPAINAAARRYPNVVVLAVDLEEGPALVRPYAQELGLIFTPVLDTTGRVTALYHVSSLPSSFFIGPDGRIRAVHVGAMDERTIEMNIGRASGVPSGGIVRGGREPS